MQSLAKVSGELGNFAGRVAGIKSLQELLPPNTLSSFSIVSDQSFYLSIRRDAYWQYNFTIQPDCIYRFDPGAMDVLQEYYSLKRMVERILENNDGEMPFGDKSLDPIFNGLTSLQFGVLTFWIATQRSLPRPSIEMLGSDIVHTSRFPQILRFMWEKSRSVMDKAMFDGCVCIPSNKVLPEISHAFRSGHDEPFWDRVWAISSDQGTL